MWQTVWAILFCIVFVYVIARSLWSQWRQQEPPVPLQGRYQAARTWLEAHGYQVVRVRERCDWIGYYG
ncbi:MAG: hypothetical protein K6T31_04570, partial [Alicyclobacillus sp.]|nr:hypothetical protein [Alicyclobacillus sp.]